MLEEKRERIDGNEPNIIIGENRIRSIVMHEEKSVIVIYSLGYGSYYRIYDGDTSLETIMKWGEDKYAELGGDGNLDIQIIREA